MTQCIVTDIDGTIAKKMPQMSGRGTWEKAVIEKPPEPIIPMRTLLQAAAQGGLYVLYATARRNVLRTPTLQWLLDHSFPCVDTGLYMCPDDLRLSQDMLKLRYLKEIQATGWEPVVWFEDDILTVETLRMQGVHAITC